MIRQSILGAVLAAGVITGAVQSTPASAGEFGIGIHVGSGFGGYQGAFFDDGYGSDVAYNVYPVHSWRYHHRHRDWRYDGWRHDRCHVVKVKRWNGHRWVRVLKRICRY